MSEDQGPSGIRRDGNCVKIWDDQNPGTIIGNVRVIKLPNHDVETVMFEIDEGTWMNKEEFLWMVKHVLDIYNELAPQEGDNGAQL